MRRKKYPIFILIWDINVISISKHRDFRYPDKLLHQQQQRETADIQIHHRIDAVRYDCLAKIMVRRVRMVKVGRL